MTDDDKPVRPRRIFDTPNAWVEPKFDRYENHFGLLTHAKYCIDQKVVFAQQIIERWAMVAGEPDGEDAAGRQKLRMQTPTEIVDRACDIAEKAFTAFEERGWVVAMPPVGEQYDMARENSDRN